MCLVAGLSLLGHCFLSGSSGVSCTGSTGNLAVIGGGHQQSGLMTVGQQLQQQKQQPSGTMGGPGFGLVTRATNTGSQTVCISPSASPRPAPTILRKRPAEGCVRLIPILVFSDSYLMHGFGAVFCAFSSFNSVVLY